MNIQAHECLFSRIFNEAISCYEAVLAVNSKNIQAMMNKGMALDEQDKVADCKRRFSCCLNRNAIKVSIDTILTRKKLRLIR